MRTARLRLHRPEFEASKYQAIFEQASDAIVTIAADGRIDDANRAVEELTGFMKEELDGAAIDLLIPDSKTMRIPDRARPLSMEMLGTPGTYEDIVIVRKDGYLRMVDLGVRLVQSGGRSKPLSLALFRDVTEKKRMERELITKHAELRSAYFQLERKNAELHSMQETLVQAGKLAALGELSAGIAHELNQPLQGIRGYAQELQAICGDTAPAVVEGHREIISLVDKMASIIGGFRAFVGKSVERFELIDLHHVIDEAIKMISRKFTARGIVVERRFESGLPPVYANAVQLEQVFINLASNAGDAIEATGRAAGRVCITTRSKGGMVEIEFRDDGIGMSSRTRDKAFNPFFTTKSAGKGMGLGLSLSYGLINKLHGSIVVESELGKGAAFLIRLPRDFRELA